MALDTEAIDKLFLELSQFTRARTAREMDLRRDVEEWLQFGLKVYNASPNAFRDPNAPTIAGLDKSCRLLGVVLRECVPCKRFTTQHTCDGCGQMAGVFEVKNTSGPS